MVGASSGTRSARSIRVRLRPMRFEGAEHRLHASRFQRRRGGLQPHRNQRGRGGGWRQDRDRAKDDEQAGVQGHADDQDQELAAKETHNGHACQSMMPIRVTPAARQALRASINRCSAASEWQVTATRGSVPDIAATAA